MKIGEKKLSITPTISSRKFFSNVTDMITHPCIERVTGFDVTSSYTRSSHGGRSQQTNRLGHIRFIKGVDRRIRKTKY